MVGAVFMRIRVRFRFVQEVIEGLHIKLAVGEEEIVEDAVLSGGVVLDRCGTVAGPLLVVHKTTILLL